MMEAQPVSFDQYQDGVQQGIGQTDSDPEKGFADRGTRNCSLSVSEPPTLMDADKASIYRHPLFPLLALLFEKCEQSTQGSECMSSASFDVDIENFVRSQEKDSKAFFSEDSEVDNLMVKAIQVLRIHLLELEKVSDLCKDFCSRYIACLKSKMNTETLLSGEPGSPYSNIQIQAPNFTGTMSPQGIVVPSSALQQGTVTMAAGNTQQVLTGGTVYQPVTVLTPDGHIVTQGLSSSSLQFQNTQLNQNLSFFSADDTSSKIKRGVLPKHAISIMRSWLFQHIAHPYPTEEEKKQIASQTNLTLLQVNNWFINARRRILQPMLDGNSTETPKTKKKTPQSRPLQRFWPNSIASTVSQQQLAMADGTMVTFGMSIDGFQTLSSDGAILAVQQVMMDNHSDEETDDSEEDDNTHLSSAHMTTLGLGTSD